MISASPIALSEVTARPLAAGLRYWLSKRSADGQPPRRQDIDPIEIPSVLPYIELTDVIDEGADLRFRLVGTHLVDIDSVNPTGQYLSNFFQVPSYRRYQFQLYRHVIENRVPLYSRSVMPLVESNSIFRTERLYCPLVDDRGIVDCIINFQICKGLEAGTVTLEMAYDPTRGEGMVAEIDTSADQLPR
ncbi:PAS domain-containing protein [Fodinicurvata sp. EGI_FJ10296]|uniref:PAS domain-containing protein n=1 Tax=Fodinicurvata sp. EGI_FJ10296 TaxID=3231908 RepID=UPI003452E86D